MNSKRSIWKLLLGGASLGLFFTNCTIQNASDKGSAGDTGTAATGNVASGSCTPGNKVNGCTCTGNVIGYQTCLADGTYSGCSCAAPINGEGGAPPENGGASGVAGTPSGGGGYAGTYVAPGAGAPGDAGAAGVAGLQLDPTDCTDCLSKLCTAEFDACAMEDETSPPDPQQPAQYCLSSMGDGSGQIEEIISCITTERANGLVKRDAVRACGSTIGASADPMFFVWAPPNMTPATEALVNCMADDPNETNPGSWATDPNNFPAAGPLPWSAGTCAKFSCTSAE
ncbi:MAG TPA: hypothetical protein VIK01_18650 [Polyangiaceae bacterium]